MKPLNSITEACGNTPLLYLENASKTSGAHLYAKLESFNPMSSVKDRVGLAMIEDGLARGVITPESLIVEPTSGNTGIALAFVARLRGLKLILTMPETMSVERQKLLKHLGATLVLTKGNLGMKGAIEEAQRLISTEKNAWMPDQFSNPANPAAHRRTTGPEIWDATGGKVDLFVAGVGSGGTLSGVSEYLKSQKKSVQAVAVEPADSPIISGGTPGPHKIQGIGANFIPKNLNTSIVDEVVTIEAAEAMDGARILASDYAVLCGISSGANFAAALKTAKKHPGKHIVFVVCDTGERYISTELFL